MLKLRLNGKAVELPAACTLAEALHHWGQQGRKFAVAVDGDFVPRGAYAGYSLRGGEDVEVLTPMQGG